DSPKAKDTVRKRIPPKVNDAISKSVSRSAKDTIGKSVLPETKDTIDKSVDSLQVLSGSDSVCRKPWQYSNWVFDPAVNVSNQLMNHHPYFGFGSRPVIIHTGLKPFYGKEVFFLYVHCTTAHFRFFEAGFS